MNKLPLPDEKPIAVNALRNKRAAIAGEIEMHSREIDRLRAELLHVDATLRLFDPETDATLRLFDPETDPADVTQPQQNQPPGDQGAPAPIHQLGTEAMPLAVKIVGAESQFRPNQRESQTDNKSTTDWGILFFTACLVVVGFLQWRVLRTQARRLGETIAAMTTIAAREAAENAELTEISRNNTAAAVNQVAALEKLRLAAEAQERALSTQAAATVTLAAAASKSADIAERSLVELERPYIFLGTLTGDLRGATDLATMGTRPTEFRAEFNLDNKGRNPAIVRAINRKIRFERWLSFDDPPYDYAFTLHGGESIIGAGLRGPVPPDPLHNLTFRDFAELGITTTDAAEFRERAFFFFGFVIYSDAQGK